MPMFKSSRPGNSGGNTDQEMQLPLTYKPMKLQRSISNSTPASVPDDNRYAVNETHQDPEIRQAPPTTDYGSRAATAAAQTKHYVYSKTDPPSSRTVAPRSKSSAPALRKKRIITPQMVKRRNVNTKHPLVMKSDESHADSRNSVVTEQTEKVSNRKDARRTPKANLVVKTLDEEKKMSTAGKLKVPPLSPAVMPKVMNKSSVQNDVKLGEKENASSASNKKKGPIKTKEMIKNSIIEKKESSLKTIGVLPIDPVFTKKEATAKANEATRGVTDTKEKAPRLPQTNASPTKDGVIPLTKRVPSGQSCSAFFLGDASTASGTSGTKKEATKRPLSNDLKGNKLPLAPKKAVPAKLPEGAADASTASSAASTASGTSGTKKEVTKRPLSKDLKGNKLPPAPKKAVPAKLPEGTADASTASSASGNKNEARVNPLQDEDKSEVNKLPHALKDVEAIPKANLPENSVKEIVSKEKSATMDKGPAPPAVMAPAKAQASETKSQKSLTIDTNLPPASSIPMSPLFSPRKKNEFEVEMPPIRDLPADEDGKVGEESVGEEKDSNGGEEEVSDERPSSEDSLRIAVEEMQMADKASEGGVKNLEAEPALSESADADAEKVGHIKKANSCCEVSVVTEPPMDLKPKVSVTTGTGRELAQRRSAPVSTNPQASSSSSRMNGQSSRRQSISSHHSTSSSSHESGKEKAAENSSRYSRLQIQMDGIGKEDAAPAEPNGRFKKNDGKLKKKKQMILTSFLPTRLDKKSKVIEEDTEYVVPEEEKEAVNQVCPSVEKSERINAEDHASDEVMDLHLNATLSDCEFSSVQSSVTTDKAFEEQPSMLKRTSSLIRNPLLRRNRSKKSEMEELAKRIKNGKMAAKADNRKVEEFEERTTGGEIQPIADQTSRGEKQESSVPPQIKTGKLRRTLSAKRTEASEAETSYAEEYLSSQVTDSEGNNFEYSEVEDSNEDEVGCADKFSEKAVSFAESMDSSEDDSSDQGLVSKGTFDDTLTKQQAKLPDVNDSVKLEMRSSSFRLAAVGGSGAPKMPSPLAQQMMRVANDETQTGDSLSYPLIRNVSTGTSKGALSHVPSVDHGTQTSDPTPSRTFTFGDGAEYQPDTAAYPLSGNVSPIRRIRSADHGIQRNPASAPTTSFGGTFGDVVESIGLFSARLCLGTGAAIASCSRACNDKPQGGPILSNGSFVEPEVQLSPRNVVFSPRNHNPIFREEQNPQPTTGAYTQVLAEAISKMPNEKQLDLVRQLSNKSLRSTQTDEHYDDMASSVDGMFRQRGVSRQKKRVPRNIAVKPKPKRTKEVPMMEQQNLEQPPEMKRVNSTDKKKPWFKRLAKKRLAVMYQV